jgi:hypothetical protein
VPRISASASRAASSRVTMPRPTSGRSAAAGPGARATWASERASSRKPWDEGRGDLVSRFAGSTPPQDGQDALAIEGHDQGLDQPLLVTLVEAWQGGPASRAVQLDSCLERGNGVPAPGRDLAQDGRPNFRALERGQHGCRRRRLTQARHRGTAQQAAAHGGDAGVAVFVAHRLGFRS